MVGFLRETTTRILTPCFLETSAWTPQSRARGQTCGIWVFNRRPSACTRLCTSSIRPLRRSATRDPERSPSYRRYRYHQPRPELSTSPSSMDFLKSAVASAIATGPPFPYNFGDKVDIDESIWTLYNGTRRVCPPWRNLDRRRGFAADLGLLAHNRKMARTVVFFPSIFPPRGTDSRSQRMR
jgi:hypothetical protein